MKKNKKIFIVILAISSLLIWGTIILKIYKSIHPDIHRIHNRQTRATDIKNYKDYLVGTYVRDPFLSIITDTAQQVAEPINKVTGQIQHEPVILPTYHGMIVSGKITTAIIAIKEEYYFLAPQSKFKDVKVLSIFPEKINVTYKGQYYTLPLKK